MFDIDDVLGQQDFLYPAQVADLREFAQATEAGEGSLQQTLRQRETGELTFTGSSRRPPSRHPLFAAAPAIAPRLPKAGLRLPRVSALLGLPQLDAAASAAPIIWILSWMGTLYYSKSRTTIA